MRMSRLLVRTSLALTVMFVAQPAAAQDCLASLIQDRSQFRLQEASSLALARLVSQSQQRSDDLSLGARIPIEGVPVEGRADYANRRASSYFENTNLEWNQERIVSVATQTLSQNAVEAYRICVRGRQNGPLIIVHQANAQEATVTIRWQHFGQPTPPPQPVVVQISGGQWNRPFSGVWEANSADARILRRVPGQDVRIVATVAGDADTAFIARVPPPPAPARLRVASCRGAGGLEGVWIWGPEGELCNGIGAWGNYQHSARDVTQLGSCIGHGGVEGVRLWGPPGEVCAGIPAWGTYDRPTSIEEGGISACVGHGNILEGHLLWGPHGERCGGMDAREWGTYQQYNRRVR